MYSITLNDDLINETRRGFADEQAMDNWLQHQVETLLIEFNTSRKTIKENARKAIEAMRMRSEQNGNSEMSLDDINNEIRLSRQARKAVL
ncbi:MAG: hypothetical protein IJP82_07550 [Bacteroidaceae bacterium]|nr:hypothetical protein [Bacteroidaceae bacterium]